MCYVTFSLISDPAVMVTAEDPGVDFPLHVDREAEKALAFVERVCRPTLLDRLLIRFGLLDNSCLRLLAFQAKLNAAKSEDSSEPG